ncbi:MAG: ferrous iron transport protein B [Clostridiales Family XIII bacterium]|jgi:ferrous iron transport protein B|nr:ferrous iron transport protein B [Clostridiales Family XIII bacterium]
MGTTIALAGNPNSGKTTMFNDITGSSQYVGNWPGVTVEKKEGKLKGRKDVIIQDLPGIYSLSPYSPEEVVARNYLFNEKPDLIIDIVDASNIERNLYLTSQLLEVGLPMVVALNMIDVAKKRNININTEKLSALLGCPVIETSAIKSQGTREAVEQAISISADGDGAHAPTFSAELETTLDAIGESIRAHVPNGNLRWYAIKVFERDAEALASLNLDASVRAEIEKRIAAFEESADDDSESVITNERYLYVERLIAQTVVSADTGREKLSPSDKIDRIVTNRILALPIFAVVMYLVYFISITTVGAFLTDWVNDVLFGEWVPGVVESGLTAIGCADWLSALILDGIVAGVGAVLGFVPQMMVLFLCLAFLEDCGYMARIAFIMDRIFRKFGLSGKSFIPILIGTGCGVPGIMASRTIESDSDRRMTVITTTFIPCGAKLPIIALIAGALFPGSTLIAPSAYFIGIAAILLSGIMLKKTKMFSGAASPFVMELPSYHLPTVKGVLVHMWDRAKAFIRKAGTIILLACIGVWFLSSFSWRMQMVAADESILADIGRFIAPIFAPLGWGEWRATVASITGLIAKENVVGTFGILYGFEEVGEEGVEYWGQLQAAFTQLAGYAFLVFNLLCAPCFAAIGAVRREMMSAKWTWFAIGYQTVFAYVVALIIYQMGLLFTGGGFTVGTAAAIILFLLIVFLLVKKPYSKRESVRVGTLQGAEG